MRMQFSALLAKTESPAALQKEDALCLSCLSDNLFSLLPKELQAALLSLAGTSVGVCTDQCHDWTRPFTRQAMLLTSVTS